MRHLRDATARRSAPSIDLTAAPYAAVRPPKRGTAAAGVTLAGPPDTPVGGPLPCFMSFAEIVVVGHATRSNAACYYSSEMEMLYD